MIFLALWEKRKWHACQSLNWWSGCLSAYLSATTDPTQMPIPPNIHRNIVHIVALLVTIIIPRIVQVISALYVKQPYHTSLLSGEGWVQELLEGHPKRIQCELGVTKDVFKQLIHELKTMGHTRSRYVSLEEQLAIFLYTSVTGLTTRHVGERFQRSNATVSKWVLYFILELHIYIIWGISNGWSKFFHLNHFIQSTSANQHPMMNHHIPSTTTRNYGHFFTMLWGLSMAVTFIFRHQYFIRQPTGTERDFYHRIAFLPAVLISSLHMHSQNGRDLQMMHEFTMILSTQTW